MIGYTEVFVFRPVNIIFLFFLVFFVLFYVYNIVYVWLKPPEIRDRFDLSPLIIDYRSTNYSAKTQKRNFLGEKS